MSNNFNKVNNFPKVADKTFTKITGAVSIAKGNVDFAEAMVCQDNICICVSAIGVAADGLQICASFVPTPNVTSFITMPVFTCYKTFV